MPVGKLLLPVLILFAVLSPAFCQECYTILTEIEYCLESSDPLTIQCPDTHWILIKTVTYRASDENTCPPPDGSSSCIISEDDTVVHDACHQQATCSVDLDSMTSTDCTGTTKYVEITYQCEPLFNQGGAARAMSLTNMEGSWSGTEANINNHPHNLLGVYTYGSAHGCSFTVAAQTPLTISSLIFSKTGTYSDDCDQKVQISDADGTYDFCVADVVYEFDCLETSRTYNLEYITEDVDVGSIFVLRILTPYNGDGFELECGFNSSALPDLTSNVDTNVVSEASVGDEGMDWKMILVIAMVSISFFIMLVVIGLVCTRLRTDWTGSVEAGLSSTQSLNRTGHGFTFITEVYVDGDQKSQLVVDKKNNRLGF